MIKNIFIFVVLLIFLGGGIWLFWTKLKSAKDVDLNPSTSPTPSASASSVPMDKISGEDMIVGTGAEAKSGDSVKVNYIGKLIDGTKFDSSYDRGTPFEFTLGVGQVIKGWDYGVVGMKVGGKRLLIIPPAFGYGDQKAGSIPPNSILVFEVELLEVIPATQ
jgi:peptidylprolyl isomerase